MARVRLLPQRLLLQASVIAVVAVSSSSSSSSFSPSVYDYYDFLEIPRAQKRSDNPQVAQLPAQRAPRFQPNRRPFKPSPPFPAPYKPKPSFRESSKPISPYFQPKTKPRYQEIGGFRQPSPNPSFSRPSVGHFNGDVNKPIYKPFSSPNQGERPPLSHEWKPDSPSSPFYYQEEEREGDKPLFDVYEFDEPDFPVTSSSSDELFYPRHKKSPLAPTYEAGKPSYRPEYEAESPLYPTYEEEEPRHPYKPRYEDEYQYEEEFVSPSIEEHTYRPSYEENHSVGLEYKENRPIQPHELVSSFPKPSYPEFRVENEGPLRETTPDYPRYEVDDDTGRLHPTYVDDEGRGGGGGGGRGYGEEDKGSGYPYEEEFEPPRQREENYRQKYKDESSPPFRPSFREEEEERRRREEEEEEEEKMIEKREVDSDSGHLDANGREFVADAAKVEGGGEGEGRLAFQIHGQQGPHSYRFGYDTGKGHNRQFRYEERGADGQVHGRYGFYDKDGKLQVVNYSAHPKHGFSADVPKH
ncbi:adhesive plaque matrix protein-like [Eriocheir sinensis]|uniref:adhesive plaque matrix protein-like n=1 Tax=Eriocheir sinensis TaxID=95602 RepID=UPI0021C68DF3|nr:adhesive plaque matrix protein-like [Eriocheir sinensis]